MEKERGKEICSPFPKLVGNEARGHPGIKGGISFCKIQP
jgi:hypothetical protein